MKKKEARREQRRAVDITATVSIAGKVVPARTRDMSRSGICLISDHAIPRDTELKIKLVLSLGNDTMSEPLLVTGRTIWCTSISDQYQVGAMFVEIDSHRRRFLDLFMKFLDGEVNPVGHEPPDPADRSGPVEDKDDPFRP